MKASMRGAVAPSSASCATATQGKLAALAPVRRAGPATRRAPATAGGKQQQQQQQQLVARRLASPSVSCAAAAEDKAQPTPLSSIRPGDEFEGRVNKVEQFGAFVNFGAAKDGLVHISQLSDGFVKNAASIVSPGQTVRVRVMSVDAGTGRVALSMKGMAGDADAEEAAYDDDEEEEEEDDMFDGEEDEDIAVEADEGNELVDVDDEPDVLYQMREDDPDMTMDAVAAFEAADDDAASLVFDNSAAMPAGGVGDEVSGKVTRVEDYGVFVEFEANGRTFTALLPADEAKLPSASLSAEDLAKKLAAAGLKDAPAYLDEDIDEAGMAAYYKIGDTVTAAILEYTEDNKIALTHWADWEVEADAKELEDEEQDLFVGDEADPLAMDPMDLIADAADDGEEDDAQQAEAEEGIVLGGESGMSRSDVKRSYMTSENQGRVLTNKMMDNLYTFPPRPLNKLNPGSLNAARINFVDTDFDLDEIELDDFWQESVSVPKSALKMMGLKRVEGERGEGELVAREGKEAREVDWTQVARYNREKEVAGFVDDLFSEDEGEAEVPVRAGRRPVVHAAAVQNVSAADVKALRKQTGAGMMDCKKALAETEGDNEKAIEWLRQKGMMGADKKAGRVAAEGVVARYIHPGSRLGVLLEVNCETDFVAASDKFQNLVNELGMLVASCPEVTVPSPEDVPAEMLAREREVEMGKEDIKSKPEGVRAKIVEGRLQKIQDNMALMNQESLSDPNKKVSEVVKETIAAVGENIQIRRFVRFGLGDGIEKKESNLAADIAQQTGAMAEAAAKAEEKPKEEPKAEEKLPEPKSDVQVSAKAVQELRRKMGAGMMDCKKALAANDGDMEASCDWLRKKGLASADKKAGRVAAEGVVASYIHPGSRLGVLLEVNCETDFVAASDQFNQLVGNIGMQIAASQTVEYVTPEDIPEEVYAREREIEMGREDIQNKPVEIRAKIAEGRTAKLAAEMALLPQPFLADQSKTVEQAVKEASASLGEKISVRRFVKYQLGEGIEKKESNLAADVAAMASAKQA